MMTQAQKDRMIRLFSDMAGEHVRVEQIKATMYAFGSELACLRIFAVYNNKSGALANKNTRIGYSENLKTWYFSLDMPLLGASKPT